MRALSFLTLLLLSLSASADSLQTALQLYQAGSPRLAMARVARDQPPQSERAAWYDWESLRLTLLSETLQAREILVRFKLYPHNAPADFQQKALGHKVWAQLELQQNVAARAALARLIWQFDLNPADLKWAQRLVIRAYLQDHKATEAYRAMLRYQQDYQPLPKEVSAEFVQGLMLEGLVTEATTWIGELDPTSPTLLALQMQAGLMAPEAALLRARAAGGTQQPAAAYAAIVADAAALLKDDRQQIDALEQWLHLMQLEAPAAGRLQQLWQAYQREAERLGNRAQLLRGDDTAWLALANSSGGDHLAARALYAYIAQQGAEIEVREGARARLYAALVAAQLDGAAVRILDAAPWGGDRLTDADLQRMLAQLAQGMPQPAMRSFYFTAGRLQEARKNAAGAADYFAQVVLSSDMREPDVLALQALQRARNNLVLAGFADDAEMFYRRAIAQKALPPKAAISKSKRKK